MKKEIIMPAVALFIICLVSSLLLAGTNAITKDKIAQSEAETAANSRKIVFAAAASFSDEDVLDEVKYSKALDGDGNTIGYVFTASNKGYGGEVRVMTAIDNSGTVLKSVVLAMDDETPGLGQNASKSEFIDQFSGKTGKFQWVKSGGGGNDIQGVTSASFTSKAVIACVNDALDCFHKLNGEG